MFSFVSQSPNFRDFLQEFSVALNTPLVNGNKLVFPEHFGKGYIAVEELPNGLLVLIIDYTLNCHLHFERPFHNDEFYSLRFETIHSSKSMVTKIDDEFLKREHDERSIIYLTCSLFDLGYLASPGTYTRALSIQLPREWLAKYLKMSTYDSILEEYIALRTATLLLEPIQSTYKLILDELKTLDLDHPAIRTIAHNRIMELIELFFTNLYDKRNQLGLKLKANRQDIDAVRKIETLITPDFTQPCPDIETLSRAASMSPTKLKKLFKELYDKPIYQYYQFYRMKKAKAMLQSGNHSVKEVGMLIGYENLSNFSTAFFKAFGVLPGRLV